MNPVVEWLVLWSIREDGELRGRCESVGWWTGGEQEVAIPRSLFPPLRVALAALPAGDSDFDCFHVGLASLEMIFPVVNKQTGRKAELPLALTSLPILAGNDNIEQPLIHCMNKISSFRFLMIPGQETFIEWGKQ